MRPQEYIYAHWLRDRSELGGDKRQLAIDYKMNSMV